MYSRPLRKPSVGVKRQNNVPALGLLAIVASIFMFAATACAGSLVSGVGQVKPDPALAADTRATEPVTTTAQTVSTSAQGAKFFVYVETLTADRPSVYGYIAPRGCTPSGVFKRGERIVWRFEVLDVATGQLVTNNDATNITLRLPYGVDVPAEFKQRGEGRIPDAPWTWDVCWDVPLDYPMGVLDYTFLITLKDGRGGTWRPPALIDPGRGIDTRPQVIE